MVVQVNGKVRARIQTSPGSKRESVQTIALEEENVQRFIVDKTVRKVIVVPDKLVNIVVS